MANTRKSNEIKQNMELSNSFSSLLTICIITCGDYVTKTANITAGYSWESGSCAPPWNWTVDSSAWVTGASRSWAPYLSCSIASRCWSISCALWACPLCFSTSSWRWALNGSSHSLWSHACVFLWEIEVWLFCSLWATAGGPAWASRGFLGSWVPFWALKTCSPRYPSVLSFDYGSSI